MMEDDDQQATCGHEDIRSDSKDGSRSSPGHIRDNAPACEDLQQGDGQSDGPARIDSNTQRRAIHNLNTGCSETASPEPFIKGLGRLKRSSVACQRARRGTSLDDLQIRHPTRTLPDGHSIDASAIALPSSRSPSADEHSIPYSRRVAEVDSLDQLVVRPELIALPKGRREGGRARIRADVLNKKNEIEELQNKVFKQGLQKSSPSGREITKERPKDGVPRRPEMSRLWKAALVALEPSRKLQQNQKQLSSETRLEKNESEANIYRTNLVELATRTSNLRHVGAVTTRHAWISRIMSYDIVETKQPGVSAPRTLWPGVRWAPEYEDFRDTLRLTPAQCNLRMIFVEDLNPSLVDYLGATFQIPPDVFEKHLDNSGYTGGNPEIEGTTRWLNHYTSPGCSSLTWYRPVVPLLPITPDFRGQLLHDRRPKVPCVFDGCNQKHYINLRTNANIWRRNLNLCPSPGVYHKGSETDYPIAWEERVTMCVRDIKSCKFVIILLDPLPFTRGDQRTGHDSGKESTRGKSARHKVKIVRVNTSRSHDTQASSIEDWTARQGPLPTPAPDSGSTSASLASDRGLAPDTAALSSHPLEYRPSISTSKPGGVTFLDLPSRADTSRARVTSSTVDTARATVLTSGHRKRSSRFGIKRVPDDDDDDDGKTGILSTLPELKPADLLDADWKGTSFPIKTSVNVHDQMVPYHPMKAGSSSSSILGDALTALDMPSYIKRSQTPLSMIEEFESALQPTTKCKETVQDPLRVLFRIVHDDCHNLTDVIRDSLQRIRQDTLDEVLMQQRVTYWRKLLHRFNSSLVQVDQQLRSFVHFQKDTEIFHFSSSRRTELPSERLAKDTSQTLRSCLDLLEKSSMELLTEMQIVVSRRSIAEAESVSKLTELAFVFIPLSFVASLFSMQVQELRGGVPLYVFTLAAMATVFIAYAMRLSIRSSRLIEYKTRLLVEIRAESHVPYNQPIPTRIFVAWLRTTISRFLSKTSVEVFAIVFPFLLVGILLAVLLSPVVLLWLRGIDRGFTIVITILVLCSVAIIFIPLAKHGYRALGISPMDIVRDLRRGYRENQKKKAKSKRHGRHRDPEAQEISANSGSGERIGLRSPVPSEFPSAESSYLTRRASSLSMVTSK